MVLPSVASPRLVPRPWSRPTFCCRLVFFRRLDRGRNCPSTACNGLTGTARDSCVLRHPIEILATLTGGHIMLSGAGPAGHQFAHAERKRTHEESPLRRAHTWCGLPAFDFRYLFVSPGTHLAVYPQTGQTCVFSGV